MLQGSGIGDQDSTKHASRQDRRIILVPDSRLSEIGSQFGLSPVAAGPAKSSQKEA